MQVGFYSGKPSRVHTMTGPFGQFLPQPWHVSLSFCLFWTITFLRPNHSSWAIYFRHQAY